MRMPMVHDLKAWPKPFAASKTGIKPFEVRLNDRGYQVGDIIVLFEYDPDKEQYTGDACCPGKVVYILEGGQFGIQPGFVVMTLEEPT